MRRSTERILSTHTGSLPRPPELMTALDRRHREEGDGSELDALIHEAVRDVVRRQADAGVGIVNDGEMSKISYSMYVKERLEGFGGESGPDAPSPDAEEFPEYAQSRERTRTTARPACIGPVAYRDREAVRTDIANLKVALAGVDAEDAFMSAASPGVIALFLENQHYPSHEAYIAALADG